MITLQFQPIIEDGKFKLTVEVTATDEMPIEVFLYRAGQQDNEEIYSAIASITDMEKYPAYYPDTSYVSQDGIVFYRKSTIEEKIFNSPLDLRTFRESIINEIEQLDKDYKATREEEGYGEIQTIILNESMS